MPKALFSPRQRRLVEFIVERRTKADKSQAEIAQELGSVQSVVAAMESGQRRIDIVELLDLAKVIGFDVHEAIRELEKLPDELGRTRPRLARRRK